MRRGYFICLLAALVLTACEKQPANKITGYTEGDYVYVAAPDGGWVTQVLVQRGAVQTQVLALILIQVTFNGVIEEGVR